MKNFVQVIDVFHFGLGKNGWFLFKNVPCGDKNELLRRCRSFLTL